jgi:threonine dehydrogenase-like Zn-dependent dehydrogenase
MPTTAESSPVPQTSMRGVYLPGGRTVDIRDVPVPTPGPGQVVLSIMASSICGSDVRAIYRDHLGTGAEAYQDVVAGHEPSGVVVEVGPECRRLRPGDRVTVYHISGCGQCAECQRGYLIGCTSPLRASYGWQRDGGHAPYMLADEPTCLPLPDELSFVDGALAACGFGTVFEALSRIGVSGRDRLLVTGLGPVGLAAGMLGRALGATQVIGAEVSAGRLSWARKLDLFDEVIDVGDGGLEQVLDASGGQGIEASIDCSGSGPGRLLALGALKTWGRACFVGEGGDVTIDVSEMLLHKQVTLYGSWVTSLRHMEELTEFLVRTGLRPERLVTDRFGLEDAAAAYAAADGQQTGKVCILPHGDQ